MGNFLARFAPAVQMLTQGGLARAALIASLSALLALLPANDFARNPRGTAVSVPAPGQPGAYFKFVPGYFLQSKNVDDVRKNGGTGDQAEINLIKPGASTAGVIIGYQPIYTFASLMRGANGLGNTQGDYTKVQSDLLTDFNNLQAAFPGAYFLPRFQSDANAGVWTNYTGGGAAHQFSGTSGAVPAYILNSGGTLNVNNKWDGSTGTTPFTLPIQPNNQYGFAYSAFNGTNYIGIAAGVHEAAIEKDLENFFTYVLTVMTLPDPIASGGDGLNHTLDKHRLVPRINMGNEISYDFTGGPADYSGSGAHAISITNFWTQYFKLANYISGIAPHTPVGYNISAGVQSGSDGSTDTASSFNTATGYLAPAVSLLGGIPGLPFIPGTYFSQSDTYGAEFTSHWNQNLGPQASNAMEAHFGVQTATGESGSLAMPTPTNASMDGQWFVDSEWQTPDYNGSTSAGSHRFYNTPTQAASAFANNGLGVTQLLQAAMQAPPPGASLPSQFANGMHASTVTLTPCSQFRAGTPPTDGCDMADYGNYIHPAIVSAGLTPNGVRALNLMSGIVINAVTVASSTSLTITWTPPAVNAAETGLTETLYRNGVVCPSCTGLTSGTFTDTGLTHGTTYAYTMAMANSNGTGPRGASVSGTP